MSESFVSPVAPSPVPDTLRARLRRDLRAAHDALDDVSAQMTLETLEGYVSFLGMHAFGMGAIEGLACGDDVAAMRADLLQRVRGDLVALGQTVPTPPSAPPQIDPLAIAYVLAGSRLGNAVLRQRWERGELARSGVPSAFITAPDYHEVWRAFCAQAREMPATGPAADRIVADSDQLFKQFHAGAIAALARKSEVYA